jgi:hypothetical protein
MKYGTIAALIVASLIGSVSANAAVVTEPTSVKQVAAGKANTVEKVYWHRRWRTHYFYHHHHHHWRHHWYR